MQLRLLAFLLAIGVVCWISSTEVESQSIRVQCKYKYNKDDYLFCTEQAKPTSGERPKCIINSACKEHRPIYEFTTIYTNSTRECQKITSCMLNGGARICHRRKACDDEQDSQACEQTPEKIEPGDCLRHKHRSSVASSYADDDDGDY